VEATFKSTLKDSYYCNSIR